MTREQVLEMTKNDCVIMRNDGRLIQDELGNLKTYSPARNYEDGKRHIENLMLLCKRIKANYTFSLVKYNDLPENLKY